MKVPARTIWDVKVQSVCSIITAHDEPEVELFMSGNFGQCSLYPPRIIINPNRLYPIEGAIRREGRFAINVASSDQRAAVMRAIRVRRRSVNKATTVGLPIVQDAVHGIPYLPGCLRTIFCEIEDILDTGDHTVMIARVLESRHNADVGQVPVLYPEVAGVPSAFPKTSRFIRGMLTSLGVRDRLKRILRGPPPMEHVDLARNTYLDGGQTDAEVSVIVAPGVKDRSRVISPPQTPPKPLSRRLGVCVVGVGQWGSYHAQLFRDADPLVDLFICGRNADRVARVARASRATDSFIGLETALADPRVDAVALVLPHHLHPWGVKLAAAAGKHILVEKPIANSLAEADRMIADARNAGVTLMVAENFHFRPAFRDVVRAIDRGDIGEPLYLKVHAGGIMKPDGWKADAELMGGGVLMDIGVHYIRALRLILGEPDRVLATKAMQVNTKLGGDDSIQVLFSSKAGWQAHMLLSWSTPRGHSPDVIVSGEHGVLQIWPSASYVELYPAAPQLLTQLVSSVRPSWLADKLMSPAFQRVRLPIVDRDRIGYLTEIREFIAAVSEGRAPSTPAIDGRRDLEIVVKAYESLAADAWVGIPDYVAGQSCDRGAAVSVLLS
ncbi:MAG: oxidoreductase domain protein [Gemmatimonadetes bacterium]|nr:oxidoreductase domain protein [Gemmatimonadota bacterium]